MSNQEIQNFLSDYKKPITMKDKIFSIALTIFFIAVPVLIMIIYRHNHF